MLPKLVARETQRVGSVYQINHKQNPKKSISLAFYEPYRNYL
jgi:hypothetical protein